jgi:ATP-binding cassette subfamily F protein 3
MVTKIVELYQQSLQTYNGNYSFYETEKQQRIEMQQRAFDNQQEYIRQQERFIERFRSKATKAAQAQSAIKRLEKLDRIEDVEIERPNIRINFRVDKTPGKIIVSLKGIHKQFGSSVILDHASAEIDRGDKVALVGANGKGKSTLLRVIAGTEPHTGERIPGHNVEQSFYAQHQLESLHLNNTLLEEMKTCGSQKTELELRALLGCFLFSGDDADKKIKVLSGGEKARVALAKTIISKANFLLLDEPTNHLDIHSCELLIEALNKYEGSYILVSHDRYFISKTANKIWEIDNHRIREFKGNYQEWVDWKERKASEEKTQVQSRPEPPVIKKESQELNPAAQPVSIAVREGKKEMQKLQRQFQELEEKITALKEKKERLEQQLADPSTYLDKQKFLQAETDYKDVTSQLQKTSAEYEKIFDKIVEQEGK